MYVRTYSKTNNVHKRHSYRQCLIDSVNHQTSHIQQYMYKHHLKAQLCTSHI